MRPDQEALTRILLAVVVLLPLAVVGGAIFLRAACQICRVAVPPFGKSMGVVVVASVVSGVAWGAPVFCLGLMAARGGPRADEAPELSTRLAQIIGLPAALLIPAGIYAHFLRIDFGKGLLVRLAETALAVAVGLVGGGLVMLFLLFTEPRPERSSTALKQPAVDSAVLAQRVADELRSQAVSRTDEATELKRAGQIQEAAQAYRDAAASWQQLAATSPDERKYREEQARALFSLGELQSRAAPTAEADDAFRKAIAEWRTLAADAPHSEAYARELGMCELALGELLNRAHRAQEAEPVLRAAVSCFDNLANEHPGERAYLRQASRSHSSLGVALIEGSRTRDAQGELLSALAGWKRLAGDPPTEPAVRHEQARTQLALGEIYLKTGDKKTAETHLRDALELCKALVAESAGNTDYLRDLGLSHTNLGLVCYQSGRAQEAEVHYHDALTLWKQLPADASRMPQFQSGKAGTMVNLAMLLRERKDLGSARALLEQAMPHHRAAMEADPADRTTRESFRKNRRALSEILIDLGEHTEGATAAQDFLQLNANPAEDTFLAARLLARCSALAENDKRLAPYRRQQFARTHAEKALAALRQAVEHGYREPARTAPEGDLEPLRALARSSKERRERFLGYDNAKALDANSDALAIWEALVAAFPAVPAYRQEAAAYQFVQAELSNQTGQTTVAQTAYRRAFVLYTKLAGEFPDQPDYRAQMARCQVKLADLLRRYVQIKDSVAAYHEALALQRQLAAEFAGNAAYASELAQTHCAFGSMLARTGSPREGAVETREAILIYKKLAGDLPGKPEYRHELARCHEDLSRLFRGMGRLKEAESDLRAALAERKLLVPVLPEAPEQQKELAQDYLDLGQLLQRGARTDEAEEPLREALTLWKKLAESFPAVADYRHQLSRSLDTLGISLFRSGRTKDAEAAYTEAMALGKTLAADFPQRPDYQNDVAATMVKLAVALRFRNETARARELLEKALPYHLAALAWNSNDLTYRAHFCNNRRALTGILLSQADHAAAADVAQQILRYPVNPAQGPYDAACLLARCVTAAEKDKGLPDAKRLEAARAYGDRALIALRQGIRNGFKDVSRLETNGELRSLRSREDFKKVLADLKTST